MSTLPRTALSLKLGLCSIVLTLAIWGWIWTRPPGAFHDQGGMMISFTYFPLALLAWLVFGLPALVLGLRGSPRTEGPGRRANALGVWTSVLALLLAIGTLVTA